MEAVGVLFSPFLCRNTRNLTLAANGFLRFDLV
jgi:hypothetical protein